MSPRSSGRLASRSSSFQQLMLSISQFSADVSMPPCASDYALLLPDPCQERRMVDKYQQIDFRTVTHSQSINWIGLDELWTLCGVNYIIIGRTSNRETHSRSSNRIELDELWTLCEVNYIIIGRTSNREIHSRSSN
jgi:hypothetical protein